MKVKYPDIKKRTFQMRHTKLVLLSIILLFTAQIAYASTYYVANGGNDNGPGTNTNPWAYCPGMSGWSGSTQLQAGDTVYFDSAGTWTAGSGLAVLVPKGGVSYIGDSWGTGTRATLLGNSGLRNAVIYFNDDDPTHETVVKGFDADANGKSLDGVSILHDGSENKSLTGATKRIENCLVHNTGSGYHYGITISPNSTNEQVSNVELINNEVYNTTRTGISNYPYTGCTGCGNSNILIQGNEVYDTGRDSSSAGHGILTKNDVENTTIINNHLHDIDTLYSSNRGHSIAIEEMGGTDPRNITIRSNLVKENGTSWLYIAGSVSSNSRSTYDIDDNTIYDNEPPNVLLSPANLRLVSVQ